MIEAFWIVVCDYRGATHPKSDPRELSPAPNPFRHTSEESALAEAARLTRVCRSQHFYVFKAIALVKPAPDVIVAAIGDHSLEVREA